LQKTLKSCKRRELAEWVTGPRRKAAARDEADSCRSGTLRYEHHRDTQKALRAQLRELAGSRVRYGDRRLTVMINHEEWTVNVKRIYRFYIDEVLIVRTKHRKERAQRQRVANGQVARRNQKWNMDFAVQRLCDGR
jgi:putative transposase